MQTRYYDKAGYLYRRWREAICLVEFAKHRVKMRIARAILEDAEATVSDRVQARAYLVATTQLKAAVVARIAAKEAAMRLRLFCRSTGDRQ